MGSETYKIMNMSIPKTCYKNGDMAMEPYLQGCLVSIRRLFHSIGMQLGTIAITVTIIEVSFITQINNFNSTCTIRFISN